MLYDWTTTWRATDREIVAKPEATADIGNIGSGSALAIRVVGVGCHASIFTVRDSPVRGFYRHQVKFVPAVAPGETIQVRVVCSVEDWSTAYVAIVWTPTPRVIRRRAVWRLPVAEFGDPPKPTHRVEGERGSTVEVELTADELAALEQRPVAEPQMTRPRGLRQKVATWQALKRYR